MNDIPKQVKVSPTKAFFVRMITRDITLEDSILDLIDNSVDGAWKCEGSRPSGLAEDVDLSRYSIAITASEDGFCIKDNCGGMSLEDAVEHAFSFGRREDARLDEFSIGVYGIGMKRAVFKLGNTIAIDSTTQPDGEGIIAFQVPIDVDAWLKNPAESWDFDLNVIGPMEELGVKITANDLTPSTKNAFGNPAFLEELIRIIGRDYSLHLNQGLTITVNGKEVSGWKITLRSSDGFKPVRFEYEDDAEGSLVTVEIIGGMADAPPESIEPNERGSGRDPYGWYIVCNGRVVLAADKTDVSGWGTDGLAKWHPQYAGFIGLVLFSAKDASDLPLTTTKRSVDRSSGVFRRSKPRLREVSTAWIKYTNQRKQMKVDKDRAVVDVVEKAAVPIPVYNVPTQATLVLPAFTEAVRGEKQANIAYSVPVSKVRALAHGFGNRNLSYREVGLQSFEYAFTDLAEDD